MMPAPKSKPAAKRATATKKATSKGRVTKGRGKTKSKEGPTRRARGATRATKPRASWKLVAKPTKNYVLNTFDAGVKILMHKVPNNIYHNVHNALIEARNRVAASLETLQVPPSKQDYGHLSSTLTKLQQMKQHREQQQTALDKTLDAQEKELQALEKEKVLLQDFGKLPGKHHPLLLEPLENELHLNFNTVK